MAPWGALGCSRLVGNCLGSSLKLEGLLRLKLRWLSGFKLWKKIWKPWMCRLWLWGLPSFPLLAWELASSWCSGSQCVKVSVQCQIWECGFAAVHQVSWKEMRNVSIRNLSVWEEVKSFWWDIYQYSSGQSYIDNCWKGSEILDTKLLWSFRRFSFKMLMNALIITICISVLHTLPHHLTGKCSTWAWFSLHFCFAAYLPPEAWDSFSLPSLKYP